MNIPYQVLAFNKTDATMTIKFDGKEALNYPAPFYEGKYLAGQELETAIQQIYHTFMVEDRLATAATLTGGEDIEAKVNEYLISVGIDPKT